MEVAAEPVKITEAVRLRQTSRLDHISFLLIYLNSSPYSVFKREKRHVTRNLEHLSSRYAGLVYKLAPGAINMGTAGRMVHCAERILQARTEGPQFSGYTAFVRSILSADFKDQAVLQAASGFASINSVQQYLPGIAIGKHG